MKDNNGISFRKASSGLGVLLFEYANAFQALSLSDLALILEV